MTRSVLVKEIRSDIKKLATPERAKSNAWFFKTGPGQYGEGDQFVGLRVPDCHTIAKKYKDLDFPTITLLLHSPIHEERMIALMILVERFRKGDEKEKEKIYQFYLNNTKFINNWDLIDLSAHKIVGPYLEDKPKNILLKLAKSESLWEKRISIIATAHYIRQNDFKLTLEIAKLLLNDKHDLIHKAVGWMLREVGKKDKSVLIDFLEKYVTQMPRTALRYAIEKFPEEKRKSYLARKG